MNLYENDARLTGDDKRRLKAILDEEDPAASAVLVGEYYRDLDRAERTPARYVYFHLGMLSGMVIRLAAKKE